MNKFEVLFTLTKGLLLGLILGAVIISVQNFMPGYHPPRFVRAVVEW